MAHLRPKAVEYPTIEPRSDTKAVAFPPNVGKQDNGSDERAEIWTDLAKKAPEASKADKTLEKIGVSTFI